MITLSTMLLLLFAGPQEDAPDGLDAHLAKAAGAPYVAQMEQTPYAASLRFQPAWAKAAADLRALQEKGAVQSEDVAKILKPHQQVATFLLKIGPHPELPVLERAGADITNKGEHFSKHLKKLTYGLHDKMTLTLADGTELKPLHYIFERSWGIGHTNRFLITFPAGAGDRMLSDEAALTITFEDLAKDLKTLTFRFPENPLKTAAQVTSSLPAVLSAKQKP